MPELPKTKPPLTPPKKRPKRTEAGYGYVHQQLRKALIAQYPLCQFCGKAFSVELHHADSNPFNTQPENLKMLCRRCHNAAHKH